MPHTMNSGRARQAASQMSDTMRDTAQEFGERARHLAEETFSRAGDYYDESRDVVRSAARSAERCVRDQPLRSMLVAVGIGCLLGAIIVRR
jgi:ElaB/YqjD/DUF883 family membrane-anchored ribosome-binding protein